MKSEAIGWVPLRRLAVGDLPSVRTNTDRILEMVAQLGTQHRLRIFLPLLPYLLGYYFTADWPLLAAEFSRMATDSDTAQMPVGLAPAGYAIHAHVRAGNEIEARRLLAALVPILETVDPKMYLHNVTVHLLSMSVWDLGAAEYAAACARLVRGVVDAGLGRAWWGPHELMLARMAALGGQMDQASQYFAQARAWAETQQHRYVAPIIDYDEALALVRAGSLDRVRIDALLDRAVGAFRGRSAAERMEMTDWEQRALALQEKLAASPAPPTPRPAYPGGLTAREVEVLRLLAGGLTNKEIAERLLLSVPTVSRHVATIYNKIDARNRADATAYALRHGAALGIRS